MIFKVVASRVLDWETALSVDPLPRSKDPVIEKIIQVMELLEKRTKELKERLEAAQSKIIQLTGDKRDEHSDGRQGKPGN
jgi:hypothetical protein